MTGLLVVVMKVLMAARKPVSSSKITSTSSNRMSDVAVLLPCSSPGALPPVAGVDDADADADEGVAEVTGAGGVADWSSLEQEASLALARLRGLLEAVNNRRGKANDH